jgi:SecD/SecF fusion protein
LPSRTVYYLFKYEPDNPQRAVPELTGDDIELKGTRQDFDTTTNEPIVLIQFTESGGRRFEKVTQRLADRGRTLYNQNSGPPENSFQQFAMVLDRDLKSAPTIDFQENPDGIPGDNGAQINGIGSVREAKDLALVLQTGALPLTFRVVSKEERRR